MNPQRGDSLIAHLSDHYCCIWLRHVYLDFGRFINRPSKDEHKPFKVGVYKPAGGDPVQLIIGAVTVQLQYQPMITAHLPSFEFVAHYDATQGKKIL